MELDHSKIDEATLALLYLTLHDRCRAWKGIDWDALDRLYEAGFIENPANKAKSVVLTEAGLERAEAAALKMFGAKKAYDAPEAVMYGTSEAKVTSAGGIRGILCRTTTEEGYFLRVKNPDGSFTDYQLRHDDLDVIIPSDALASLYVIGENRILDHSPEVLGLRKLKK